MPLDERLAVVRAFLNPHVSRSGLDRCPPARCLSNALTQWAEDVAPADIPSYPCAYNLIKALTIAAKAKGATAYAAQWAGAQAARARALPARELVEALDKEMKDSASLIGGGDAEQI